jgi:hypothetical protein
VFVGTFELIDVKLLEGAICEPLKDACFPRGLTDVRKYVRQMAKSSCNKLP